jgi:hypothetical protein
MRKYLLVSLVATLGLVVAAPAGAGTSAEDHARAHVAKKKCKKKGGAATAKKKCKKKSVPPPVTTPVTPPTPPATPTPLALTNQEVINRVVQKAGEYCSVDPDCIAYGYYYDGTPSVPACDSKTTYTWACYGWNDEDASFDPPNATCDFREIISRSGYNGITSQQDLSFGVDGWDCYVI